MVMINSSWPWQETYLQGSVVNYNGSQAEPELVYVVSVCMSVTRPVMSSSDQI